MRSATAALWCAGCACHADVLPASVVDLFPWPDPPAHALPDVPVRPPLPAPGAETFGPLTGLTVYLSPGHGHLVYLAPDERTPIMWSYQRDVHNGMQEDRWTQKFAAQHLVPQLEALGATVISLRELDTHAEAVVVDDESDGFWSSEIGARREDALAQDAAVTDLPGGAWAQWNLRLPAMGAWRLYARTCAADDPRAATRYVVVHGKEERRYDLDATHRDGLWWPLGVVEGAKGDEVTVRLQREDERPFCADAVRLGGGSFQVVDPILGIYPPVPWAEVSTSQHLPHLGGPEALLWLDDGRRISDMRLRARWTSWAHTDGEEAVFLSIHTNAGPGRGSIVFYGHDPDATPPSPARAESIRLANTVTRALERRLIALDPEWRVHEATRGNYSEISPFWNEVDGVLIEVGYHDKPGDAARLVRQDFQIEAATAITEAVVAWRDGP